MLVKAFFFDRVGVSRLCQSAKAKYRCYWFIHTMPARYFLALGHVVSVKQCQSDYVLVWFRVRYSGSHSDKGQVNYSSLLISMASWVEVSLTRPETAISRWTQLNSACSWSLRDWGPLLEVFPPNPKPNNSVHVLSFMPARVDCLA